MTLITPTDARGRPTPVRIARPGDRRSSSRSATRALDVLELFGHARRPLRAVEIARTLALHPSTTNQLLKTMVDSAHLLFNAREMTYQPSPRLAGISGWIVELYGAEERLGPMVRDVAARTGMIVTLSTANDLFMQLLDLSAPADQPAERGQRVSLFGSAIGSAYLSLLDDAEIVRLADRARIAEADVAGICRSLSAIRRQGYADGPLGSVAGGDGSSFWSIGRPLPPSGLPVRLVLGLSGPGDQVRERLDTLADEMAGAIARWS